MARTFTESLAQVFPAVAAMWHPDRNGSLTPDRVGTGGGRAWWRCPAGHEWEETVISRRSLPKWKGGDVAACRECVGYRVRRVFPGCGCVKMVRPGTREAEHAQCHACRTREFEENAPRIKAELSAAAKASADRAVELLDAVRLPAGMPGGLVVEWRYWAAGHLQGAMAAEQVLEKAGETRRTLEQVTAAAGQAVPTPDACAAAAGRDGVLNILGRAYWADGWRYALSGRPGRSLTAELLEGMRGGLQGWLEDWTEQALADREAGRTVPATTAEVTRELTGEVRQFLKTGLGAEAMVYAEARLPLVPDGKSRYGRVDLLAWSPGPLPDFVVEIDSAPNPSSAQKLAFARDAGAVPLWVRFGSGQVEDIDGVGVVDARELIRSVVAPR
ncbi:zinc-ribbon domain-containing protein [Streptomyces sp. NPDC097981]|uniref:zinc-ribbon domain-containing protein n=1 Tax=Streptomyces sp. NPDC097981 TaxID=3155428 RepID=UPI00331F07E3